MHAQPDPAGAYRRKMELREAIEVLKGGGPLIFQTDTVLGLGIAVSSATFPDTLFELKGRERSKPVSCLVGSIDDLELYGYDVPESAIALANAFWPGPLTIVVKASDAVPQQFVANNGTIGLRCPAPSAGLTLVHALGSPIAATSANLSGSAPAASLDDLPPALQRVQAFLDGRPSGQRGISSTVVDCTGSAPCVLREGEITSSQIDDVIAGREAHAH